jgi:hypothetical protein
MHLRVSTKRTSNKVYRYAQVVQSYRRDDGVPAHRVVAHLGALPEPLIEALRLAFQAASSGEAIVLGSDVAKLLRGSTTANLRYLDLAVLIDCWQGWELFALLDDLVGDSSTSLSLSDVIVPLVLQRCCAPRSKLEATRWFPTTALPELLGIELPAFNNSRIHRALDALYAQTEALQLRLVDRYQQADGPLSALFMDVTDTYFEGIGCPMAEQTRTKSEMPNKRCLGIVLLVNEHGYPVRWKVVGGKTKDWHAMGGLLHDIGDVSWLKDVPLVFDRAMGTPSTVAQLKAAQLHFLTAAHCSSIETYTTDLPWEVFADIDVHRTTDSYEQDIEHVAQAARDAGFAEIHERLFVFDLGVEVPACEQPEEPSPGRRKRQRGLAQHLRRAQAIHDQMGADPGLTQAAVALSLGISERRVNYLLALLRLAPAIQDRILQWKGQFPLIEKSIRPLLALEPDEQLRAFDELLSACTSASTEMSESSDDEPIGPLRLVAYFNPRLFVDTRRRVARAPSIPRRLRHRARTAHHDLSQRSYDRFLPRPHHPQARGVGAQTPL